MAKRERNLNVVAHYVAMAMSHDLRIRLVLRDGTAKVGRVLRRVIDPALPLPAEPKKRKGRSNLRLDIDTGENVALHDVERIERA